jgi:FtsP/CotA-like multicopper oxidase with cupredoxin domain
MSRGLRFTFLGIALVIAIVAIVVLADSSEDDSDAGGAAATATPADTPTATPTATAEREATPTATPEPTPPPPPLLTASKVTELEFKQGETVRFRVRSDTADHVHVHGYDLMKDVAGGKTTTMSFKATITGIFEIEFEDAHKQIAELKVEPG